MKYFITMCIAFLLTITIYAQESSSSFSENMSKPGEHKKSVSIFMGFNNNLYGYEDERYVGDDKGDYLETTGSYYGAEFFLTGFGAAGIGQDLRFGINTNNYYRGGFNNTTLYAVPSRDIEAREIISDDIKRAGKLYNYTGFFFGLDRYLFGIDAGLTAGMRMYYESTRQRYQKDGSIKDVDGRGWIMDKGELQMNMFMRVGPESMPHFIFERFRENYDPVYGNTIVKIVFPVNQYFKFSGGGTLDSAASIFIEPAVVFNGFGLSARCGSNINYFDSDLKRVGLQDTLFFSFSFFKEW